MFTRDANRKTVLLGKDGYTFIPLPALNSMTAFPLEIIKFNFWAGKNWGSFFVFSFFFFSKIVHLPVYVSPAGAPKVYRKS